MWKTQPASSLAGGAYENIGPAPGQTSTSVILAVVTDDQTLGLRLFLKKVVFFRCYILIFEASSMRRAVSERRVRKLRDVRRIQSTTSFF